MPPPLHTPSPKKHTSSTLSDVSHAAGMPEPGRKADSPIALLVMDPPLWSRFDFLPGRCSGSPTRKTAATAAPSPLVGESVLSALTVAAAPDYSSSTP
jgi:hypothetical protein